MQSFRLSKLSKQLGFIGLPSDRFTTRNSRPTGGGGGSGTWSDNFRTVVNIAGVSDFSGFFPYCNAIKMSSRSWEDGGVVAEGDSRMDANYEPGNLGPGQSMGRLQWIISDMPSPQLKTGTWVCKWDGAGNFYPAGFASTLTGPGRRTFTVNAGNTLLYMNAENGPCTNLRLCHIDHEAALDAGELLNPDFVAWLNSWPNVKAFRFLDILATNLSTIVNAADWTPLTYISWSRGTRGAPPEILAEVAKKTGDKPVWPTMPYLATDSAMLALYQRMKNWYNGTYTVVSEGINEPWNFGFPGTLWLNDTYGFTVQNKDVNGNNVPNTDLQNRMNSAYAHHTLRCWTAADAVFGSDRVRLVGCVQTDFAAFFYQWANYSDPAYFGGQRLKTLLNARGNVVVTHYYSAGVNYKTMSLDDWGNKTDNEWVNAWKTNIDINVNTNWPATITNMAAIGCTAKLLSYEGGCHDFIDAHGSPWNNFSGTVNTVDNTMTMSAADYAGFTQFDNVAAFNQSLGGGLTSFGVWAFCRKLAGNRLRLYPSLAAATADTGDTGAGAGVMNAGTFLISNITRHFAIQNKIYSLLQGTRGQEIAEYIQTGMRSGPIAAAGMSLFAGPSLMRVGTSQRFTYCFEAPNRGVENIGNESPYVNVLRNANFTP